MGFKNTTNSYGSMAIALHWIMAVIIITLIIVGFYMTSLPDGDDKWKIYALHKATGLIVMALALFRWYWTLSSQSPQAVPGLSKAEIGISHASKWLLMILIVVMPFSGILMSLAGGHDIHFFGIFTIDAFVEKNETIGDAFHEIHEIAGWVIAIIVGLHILAALKHHLLLKNDTLNRMLGRK